MFGAFVLSWLLARHVFYMMVCWSIYTHIPEEIPDSCYTGQHPNLNGPLPIPESKGWMLEPFYKTNGIVCWNSTIRWSFLSTLLVLQVITIGWFFMILRVVMKVLRGGNAEDTRSDDEGECEEEEEGYVYEEAQALEEEVGVEDIDLKSWERRTGIKRQASASGVSLPGHSDRKELLGRIGCEKQVD